MSTKKYIISSKPFPMQNDLLFNYNRNARNLQIMKGKQTSPFKYIDHFSSNYSSFFNDKEQIHGKKHYENGLYKSDILNIQNSNNYNNIKVNKKNESKEKYNINLDNNNRYFEKKNDFNIISELNKLKNNNDNKINKITVKQRNIFKRNNIHNRNINSVNNNNNNQNNGLLIRVNRKIPNNNKFVNKSLNDSNNKSYHKNHHFTSRINRSLNTYKIPQYDSFDLANNNYNNNNNFNYNNRSLISIKFPINNHINNFSVDMSNSPKRGDSQISNRSNSSKSSAFKRKFSKKRRFSERNYNNDFKNFTERNFNNNENNFSKKNIINSDNFEKYEINNIIPVNEKEIKKIFNSNGINIYNLKDTKHDIISGKYSLQFNINKNINDKNFEKKLNKIKRNLPIKKIENKYEKKETITNRKNFYENLINDYKNINNDNNDNNIVNQSNTINHNFTNTYRINHKYKNFINYQTHGNN